MLACCEVVVSAILKKSKGGKLGNCKKDLILKIREEIKRRAASDDAALQSV